MIKYLKLGLKGGWKVLFSTPWIKRYAKHPERYPLVEERYPKIRGLIKYVIGLTKVHFIVKGEENILTDTNVVYAPNHQSNMDPLSLIALSETPLTFVSKKETISFPYVGNVIKGLNGIFIDRKDLRQEVQAMGEVSMLLQSQPRLSICIFPEGTRSKDPFHTMASFKPGALKAAYNANKPIIPVAIYGSFRVLDKKCVMDEFPIQVTFLKPHMPSEYEKTNTTQMAKILYDEISVEVEKLRKNDVKLVEEFKYPKKQIAYNIKGV